MPFCRRWPWQTPGRGDAHVFHRVVVVDVQVAFADDIQVDQPVTGDLVQHALKKRYTDIKSGLSGAIQVDRGFDLGFQSVALDGLTITVLR